MVVDPVITAPMQHMDPSHKTMAPTTTVVMTATRARAQSTQMMLDPQWVPPMTMLTAPHPTTPTATALDPPLVTDLMDMAMGRDPRLTLATTVALRAPLPAMGPMVLPPVPSLTMVAQMVAHMGAHMTALTVAQMAAQMAVPMEVEGPTKTGTARDGMHWFITKASKSHDAAMCKGCHRTTE